MSLFDNTGKDLSFSFPRVSGDEPLPLRRRRRPERFSPRERG